MTPSETIIQANTQLPPVADRLGRKIKLRRLNALDRLRIYKAAGPELALNQPWLAMALLASSVTAIDEIPVPVPVTEGQIEHLVERLGDHGMDAVAEALDTDVGVPQQSEAAMAGNFLGTPN
jgi:hypothetical protein